MTDQWTRAKGVINHVRSHGQCVASPFCRSTPLIRAFSSYAPRTVPSYTAQSSAGASSSYGSYHKAAPPTVPSSVPPYNPYAPPRRPTTIPSSLAPPTKPKGVIGARRASTLQADVEQGIRFKESPFFQVLEVLSAIAECPGASVLGSSGAASLTLYAESASATDRRQQTLSFAVSSDISAKVKAPGFVHVACTRLSSMLTAIPDINCASSAHHHNSIPMPPPSGRTLHHVS